MLAERIRNQRAIVGALDQIIAREREAERIMECANFEVVEKQVEPQRWRLATCESQQLTQRRQREETKTIPPSGRGQGSRSS